MLNHKYNFGSRLFYILSNFLHDNFLNICGRKAKFFCKAFRRLGLGPHIFVWSVNLQWAFQWSMIHKGRFFAIKEFFSKANKLLDGSYFGKYDTRNWELYHKPPHKNMKFKYSQQHLNSSHSSTLLNASSYMANNHHDDNFFHTYGYDSWVFFSIFYRIGIFASLNCILQFCCFCRIHNL